MRVYISSTSEDLKEYRAAVIAAIKLLEHEPVAMEYYVASPVTPVDKCLRDVIGCDLYVGLFAWRYGFIPDGYELSITELEYREAKKCDVPRLIFLVDEDTHWQNRYRDEGENGKKVQLLREELQKEYIVSFFKNPDDLATKVTASVSNHFTSLLTNGLIQMNSGSSSASLTERFQDRTIDLAPCTS